MNNYQKFIDAPHSNGWKVQAFHGVNKYGTRVWECECPYCHSVCLKTTSQLNYGTVKSCGCVGRLLHNEAIRKHNRFEVCGDFLKVYYTNRPEQYFLCDTSDYELIEKYSWRLHHSGYVTARINGRQMLFHRLVLNDLPDEMYIDHISGNRSDNRRGNQRVVSRSENAKNRGLTTNNTSGHSGVKKSSSGKWVAEITVNKKRITLGRYEKFDDAISAREAAEDQYFGEFKRKNDHQSNC